MNTIRRIYYRLTGAVVPSYKYHARQEQMRRQSRRVSIQWK